MKLFLKRLILAFVLLMFAAVGMLAWQWQQFVSQPIACSASVSASQVVEIKPGATAGKVAQTLHQAGLLDSPKWFVWYLRYHDKHAQIKTGEMRIDPMWTVAELTEALIRGETVKYPATLIAGQTFLQTLQQLQALPKLKLTLDEKDLPELYAVFNLQPIATLDAKRYPYAGLEGRFLPETYLYESGDRDVDILLRAHKALQNKIDQAWSEREAGLPYKTSYEALIMASLVEKETAVPSERSLIAGVFTNRLKKRMRLQTDPTVIYGIGSGYDGNIRKRDLLTTTPYNTYRINGMPPTPIALPSAEALDAVLHPAKTNALYFVSKGNGEHYFSTTLIEHNRAVRKYQLQ